MINKKDSIYSDCRRNKNRNKFKKKKIYMRERLKMKKPKEKHCWMNCVKKGLFERKRNS